MNKFATLGYLKNNGQILLGKKKYGGAKGKLNGFGGKVEETDATFKDALIREFKEETGLDVSDPVLRGSLVFPNNEGKHVIHIYEITDFEGELTESDEMTVDWYDIKKVKINEMWPNDQVWFPLLALPFNFVVTFSGPKINDYDTTIDIRLVEVINEKTFEVYL